MKARRPGLLAAMVWAMGVWASGAAAFDGVVTTTILPDEDFFRLVTCGAPPGGDCTSPTVRWRKRTVTLALLPSDATLTPKLQALLDRALDVAVDEVNGTGAGLRLRRTDRAGANIRIYVTDEQPGDQMTDKDGWSGTGIMGVGFTTIWWNGRKEITEATILISTAMSAADMASVVLEEVVQTLGPRFDVEGGVYEGVSILAQDSNETVRLEGQDARLLRWLYPTNTPDN